MTYLLPVRVADSCGVDQKRRQTIGQWQGRRRAWQVTPPPPCVLFRYNTHLTHYVTLLGHGDLPGSYPPSHLTLSLHPFITPFANPHPSPCRPSARPLTTPCRYQQ